MAKEYCGGAKEAREWSARDGIEGVLSGRGGPEMRVKGLRLV